MATRSREIAGSSADLHRSGDLTGESPHAPAAWLKFALPALMLVMIGALLWVPLRHIGTDTQINYNEGWNAYKQTMARNGVPLYSTPPDALTGATTYPPVSFHLIGGLARLPHGDVVRTGRWVSLLSLMVTGVMLGLIGRRLGADATVAVFSTLLYILGIAIFLPDRLGMDDPQLLGEAFTTAGLYCYIRGRERTRLLMASALLFCLAGFTKQNLLAFPAAAGLDLLLRSRRRFVIWLAAMIGFAGGLTALTLAVDGRYFTAHLLLHRTYSFDNALVSATQYYLVTFQGIVLVAIVWMLCRARSSPLLTAAFLASNALAFALSGGDGVDLNIYFNAFAAGVLICAVAAMEFEGSAAARPQATRRYSGMKAAALMTGLFLCVSIAFPDRLDASHLRGQQLPGDEADFRAAVALIQGTPGAALCENLLLCYRAGKPYVVDTFAASDQLDLGALDEDAIPAMLRSHKFGAVELEVLAEETSPSTPLVRRRPRFSEESMDALLANYSLRLRTAHMLIFVPK